MVVEKAQSTATTIKGIEAKNHHIRFSFAIDAAIAPGINKNPPMNIMAVAGSWANAASMSSQQYRTN